MTVLIPCTHNLSIAIYVLEAAFDRTCHLTVKKHPLRLLQLQWVFPASMNVYYRSRAESAMARYGIQQSSPFFSAEDVEPTLLLPAQEEAFSSAASKKSRCQVSQHQLTKQSICK